MKTLELNLPTPLLLVWGLSEDAEGPFVSPYQDGILGYWRYNGHLAVKVKIPKGNWQLIGKLSELTEEQAKGLVESIEIPFAPDEICYPDYSVTGFKGLDTALESFHSAIEAECHYAKNPWPEPEIENYLSGRQYKHFLHKWQDDQSKTLPANTLIFKRV